MICMYDCVLFSLLHLALEGTVRLVGGSGPHEGRVEVYHLGEWGTVCDDLWDLTDALVVCRQQGYLEAVSAPGNAFFGPGSGTIWYDNVACDGTENNITQCDHNGLGIENCAHSEDAGVVCAPSKLQLYLLPTPCI